MTDRVKVFILAAGYGERLRPITNLIPKPLLPVLGRPVLGRVLDHLSSVPFSAIGMNLHYKANMIKDWCAGSSFAPRLTFLHEERILGTAGGLKNASRFLDRSTFLVLNADILHDFDLSLLLETHRKSGNIATLAVIDHEEINSLHVGSGGILAGVGDTFIGRGGADYDRMTFSGVAVYEPEFLDFIPEGRSGVVDAWFTVMRKGHRVGCLSFGNSFWSDIGTPLAYGRTVMKYLRDSGEQVFIHPSVSTCDRIEVEGHVIVEEDVIFEKRVRVKGSIVLPGSTVNVPDDLLFVIAGTGFRVPMLEEALFPQDAREGGHLIGTGGSDRDYFRVKHDADTRVLLVASDRDEDFERHMDYSMFFRKHGVPVPELIRSDKRGKRALFQDLGDITIYSWLKCPRDDNIIFRIYEGLILHLVHLHMEVTRHVDECPLLKERVFDRDHFRWETQYFLDRYLGEYRKIRLSDDTELCGELDLIASMADSFDKSIVHRDCQAQNIMRTRDGHLYFIDYQGARLGPAAYDVASLLWDPYYRLNPDMRDALVDSYCHAARMVNSGFDLEAFKRALVMCRLQRHMQALGAYSFLSLEKGKHYFQKHMPEALRLLKEDVALVTDEFPYLSTMIRDL